MTDESDELARVRRVIALVLAAIGLIAAVAAAVGFPLVFVVGRGSSNVDRFASSYRSEYAAWLDHDGWAWSGSAWFSAAFALAAFMGAALVAGVVRARGTWALGLVSGPAVLVLAFGPLLQHLAGVGWSNYGAVDDGFLPWSPVFAVVVLVLWSLAIGPKLVRERRRSRRGVGPDSAPRGARSTGRHRV